MWIVVVVAALSNAATIRILLSFLLASSESHSCLDSLHDNFVRVVVSAEKALLDDCLFACSERLERQLVDDYCRGQRPFLMTTLGSVDIYSTVIQKKKETWFSSTIQHDYYDHASSLSQSSSYFSSSSSYQHDPTRSNKQLLERKFTCESDLILP